MAHVGGVFVVLLGGCALACVMVNTIEYNFFAGWCIASNCEMIYDFFCFVSEYC